MILCEFHSKNYINYDKLTKVLYHSNEVYDVKSLRKYFADVDNLLCLLGRYNKTLSPNLPQKKGTSSSQWHSEYIYILNLQKHQSS